VTRRPFTETALDATLGQEAGHLLPAAMHHHQPDATFGHRGQLGRQTLARILGIQQRAPILTSSFTADPRLPRGPAPDSCSEWPGRRALHQVIDRAHYHGRPVAASSVTPMSQ